LFTVYGMADELGAPFLPERQLSAPTTQPADGPLFTPRPLTYAELLAETEPPARDRRRTSLIGWFGRVSSDRDRRCPAPSALHTTPDPRSVV
jgi:hypothetical protein